MSAGITQYFSKENKAPFFLFNTDVKSTLILPRLAVRSGTSPSMQGHGVLTAVKNGVLQQGMNSVKRLSTTFKRTLCIVQFNHMHKTEGVLCACRNLRLQDIDGLTA